MWREYAPEPRMRLNLGIRRRLAPLLDNNRGKIELANSLLMTLTGTPIVYYGDEIGMGDNIWLQDRDGVRTPMQWNSGTNAGFSEADADELYSPVIAEPPYGPETVSVAAQQDDPASLLNVLKRMISVRKAQPAFAASGFTWVEAGTDQVAAYLRQSAGERLLIVNNLADEPRDVEVTLPGDQFRQPSDLLSGAALPPVQVDRAAGTGVLRLALPPFGYRWLKI